MTQGAERKARRDALGWDTERAAEATCPFWQDVRSGESVAAHEIEMIESGYANFVETFPAAYDAALTAEETRRREVGAKLRARREGLEMSYWRAGDAIRAKSGREYESVDQIECGDHVDFDARAAAYTAVLDEAEARRGVRDEARRVLARERNTGVRTYALFAQKHLPELDKAWERDRWDVEAPSYAAIKAEVTKLAEEPEPTPIVADPSPVAIHAPNGTRLRIGEVTPTTVVIHVEPEPAADPDPMPEPPEGVTVVSVSSGWRVDREADRGVLQLGRVSKGTGNVWPWSWWTPAEAALFGSLAEWAHRQHTRTQEAAAEAERARLLEAVRVAEEALTMAAERRASAHREARETARAEDEAITALSAARKAAGL